MGAYFYLANLMIDPEDYEKAKKNYLIAIDIKDDFAEAHFELGKLLFKGLQNDETGTLIKKPDYDSSIFHLEKAINEGPLRASSEQPKSVSLNASFASEFFIT